MLWISNKNPEGTHNPMSSYSHLSRGAGTKTMRERDTPVTTVCLITFKFKFNFLLFDFLFNFLLCQHSVSVIFCLFVVWHFMSSTFCCSTTCLQPVQIWVRLSHLVLGLHNICITISMNNVSLTLLEDSSQPPHCDHPLPGLNINKMVKMKLLQMEKLEQVCQNWQGHLRV